MTNSKLTNFIKFEDDNIASSRGEGRISTLTHDIEIRAVPFVSENPQAPTHRLFGKSPKGFDLEVGGIWEGRNNSGAPKFTLHIRDIKYNANLGRFAEQDDFSLQAVIPWQSRD